MKEVPFFHDKIVTKVYAKEGKSYAITSNGKVYAWGLNLKKELGLGKKTETYIKTPQEVTIPDNRVVSRLALGEHHTLALTEDGKLYAWGKNKDGRLGIVTYFFMNMFRKTDRSFKYTATEIPFFQDKEVIDIAAGQEHSLAMTSDGKVYSWGCNSFGQLGLGMEDTYLRSLIREEKGKLQDVILPQEISSFQAL